MWRNFLSKVAPITKHFVNPIESVTASYAKTSETKRAAAREALGSAVKELSEGSASALSLPPVNILKTWDTFDFDRLSIDQLEDLGRAHHEGIDAEDGQMAKNPQRAVEVFKYASERGSQTASYSYAVMLKDGVGVEKNTAAAFEKLSVLANDHNYNLAHYGLAVMLSNGEVTIDHEAAFKHFNKAARLGVLPAIYNVGNYHSSGLGRADKNENRAYQCYLIGAQGGDPSAMYSVGTWIYQGRNGVERDLKEAFKWQKKAADIGHPAATFNTGHAYMSGEGTEKDIHLAIQYFEMSLNAGGGLVQAGINLGNIYREGHDDVAIDLPKARKYFEKFADRDTSCADMVKNIDEEIADGKGKEEKKA